MKFLWTRHEDPMDAAFQVIDTLEYRPADVDRRSLTETHLDQISEVIGRLQSDRSSEVAELERLNASIAACDIRIGEIDKSIAAFELAHGELRR